MTTEELNSLLRKPAIARRNGLHETERKMEGAIAVEMDLHREIVAHCDQQWPRWKYIRARSDTESTIQAGCQDFTIFRPGGKTLCVECKSKNGKLSEAQSGWAHEMGRLGHRVHVVRSMDEFLNLL